VQAVGLSFGSHETWPASRGRCGPAAQGGGLAARGLAGCTRAPPHALSSVLGANAALPAAAAASCASAPVGSKAALRTSYLLAGSRVTAPARLPLRGVSRVPALWAEARGAPPGDVPGEAARVQEAHEAVARKIAPLAGPDGEACSQARGVNSASSQVATCRAGRRAGGYAWRWSCISVRSRSRGSRLSLKRRGTHGGGRASPRRRQAR